MTNGEKSIIFLSNTLDMLADALKQGLYAPGTTLFEERLIVVPSLALKSYLTSRFALDPDLNIAAGLTIVNLPQALAKLTGEKIPSNIELSLFIQDALPKVVELRSYLVDQRRVGPFCDALAEAFTRYGMYGLPVDLPAWQKRLFDKVGERFRWPCINAEVHYLGQLHIFGFSCLPAPCFAMFQKWGASIYTFSPCETFWGDVYSDKEKGGISNEQLWESFAEQNPLLANWGRVGRKMVWLIDESGIQSEELYVPPVGGRCLHRIQGDLLEGAREQRRGDDSIRFVFAPSILREIEVVKDEILSHMEAGVSPDAIRIYAPDMGLYAAAIQAVFGGSEDPIPFSISDLPVEQIDPVCHAFSLLMDLKEKRLSRAALLTFFSLDPVQERLAFRNEDIELIRKWLERVNVRWGYSREDRAHYLREEYADQEIFVPQGGTWKGGIDRLLRSLAEWGEEIVSWTEVEVLDRFHRAICSLNDDLTPLSDGTKWTVPTWIRYFAALLSGYIQVEPHHDFYQSLQNLAASLDVLDAFEVTYVEVERIWRQLVRKKSGSIQPKVLPSLTFSSLSEGSVQPAEVICLLGMGGDAFPRVEAEGSLFLQERSYRPKQREVDRYLLLQAVSMTRRALYISMHASTGCDWTLPIQELRDQIAGVKVDEATPLSTDPANFQGEKKTYSQRAYMGAKCQQAKRQSLLIPSWQHTMSIELAKVSKPREIPFTHLVRFARHPLRFYLEEVLGIDLRTSLGNDSSEQILSPLGKYVLVQEGIQGSIDDVLKRAEERGELPSHLCASLAKQQVRKEHSFWMESLSQHGLKGSDLHTLPFSLVFDLPTGQQVVVRGELPAVSPAGVWVRKGASLADQIRFWPHALVARILNLGPLLSVETGEPLPVVMGSWESFLTYFLHAEEAPSPLVSKLVQPFLEGDVVAVGKGLNQWLQDPDDALSYLLLRDPPPSAEALHTNWATRFQSIFEVSDAIV